MVHRKVELTGTRLFFRHTLQDDPFGSGTPETVPCRNPANRSFAYPSCPDQQLISVPISIFVASLAYFFGFSSNFFRQKSEQK